MPSIAQKLGKLTICINWVCLRYIMWGVVGKSMKWATMCGIVSIVSMTARLVFGWDGPKSSALQYTTAFFLWQGNGASSLPLIWLRWLCCIKLRARWSLSPCSSQRWCLLYSFYIVWLNESLKHFQDILPVRTRLRLLSSITRALVATSNQLRDLWSFLKYPGV